MRTNAKRRLRGDRSGALLENLAGYVQRVLDELRALNAEQRGRVLEACLELNRAVRLN